MSRKSAYPVPSGPKSGKPSIVNITPTQRENLLGCIRAGVTPWVAIQTVCKISANTFYRWFALGRQGYPPYDAFVADVDQAAAIARTRAEHAVAVSNPEFWLRYGPGGRDQGKEKPGWVDESKVRHTDPTGNTPPTIRIEFSTGSPKTVLDEPAIDVKALEEGSDLPVRPDED